MAIFIFATEFETKSLFKWKIQNDEPTVDHNQFLLNNLSNIQ